MSQISPVNQYEKRLDKIHQILEEISIHKNKLLNISYSRGLLGVSLFYFLYGKFSESAHYIEEAKEIFEKTCNSISGKQDQDFYLNLSELGILTEYLHRQGILDIDPNEFLGDADKLLHEQMRIYLKEGYIGGFINGATSLGLYFLHRLPSNPNYCIPIVKELIEGIKLHAIRTPQGYYWKINSKEEKVYLTIPHGLAATVLLFTKAVEYGIDKSYNIYDNVTKSISFLLNQEVMGKHFKFNDQLHQYKQSRLALCYGDMGVGYTLLRAGNIFSNENWYNKGLQILRDCTHRQDLKTSGVVDASILYGTTGLGLMFDRIYTITKEEVFHKASDYWYNRILEYAYSEDGYAGFKAAYNQWHIHTNLSFWEGIIGIGAGLIKSLRRDTINFDELIWLF